MEDEIAATEPKRSFKFLGGWCQTNTNQSPVSNSGLSLRQQKARAIQRGQRRGGLLSGARLWNWNAWGPTLSFSWTLKAQKSPWPFA